jgi:two-component system C4-dicarboxylate transport sensor histidine kinase DctB
MSGNAKMNMFEAPVRKGAAQQEQRVSETAFRPVAFSGPIRPLSLRRMAIWLAGIVVCAAVVWQVAVWTRALAVRDLHSHSLNTLNLIVANLRGTLAKHRYYPSVLARLPIVVDALAGRRNPAGPDQVNAELERLANLSGALDIYLIDTKGTTIAASNWSLPRSFIGQNFWYRPYFQDAMRGVLGRFYAVGTTSGERGYYFASPVSDNGKVVGVVAVKLQIGELEPRWRYEDREVVVIGAHKAIFMSSRPSWVLTTVGPLTELDRRELAETRRYAGRSLRELPRTGSAPWPKDTGFVDVRAGGDEGGAGKTDRFLVVQNEMHDVSWTVAVLAKTNGIELQVRQAIAISIFMLATLLLGVSNILQRRRRNAERLAVRERITAELERRVAERTAALTQANRSLTVEIGERKRAEEELRNAQNDLIQAAKLAVIGQMSASVGHELNQPLAAIKTYSENARAFLDGNRPERASANLSAISELTERMARIVRQLRNFARKETVPLKPVELCTAIGEALELLAQRISSAGVVVDTSGVDGSLWAMAGEVRLQQVLVNLIANAMDAMEGRANPVVTVSAAQRGRSIVLEVSDNGPGIAPEKIAYVFDPFFTTKEAGGGLGLGLSITESIIRQFGGEIAAANRPDGGAVFTITLVSAVAHEDAAE